MSAVHNSLLTVIVLLVASRGVATVAEDSPSMRLNVLFIGVDDLRPVLGCYGDRIAKTPNLDALAACGTVFTRAYCQLPVCLPSRTSILTGLRIATTGIRTNRDGHFRRQLPDVITLPQRFKNSGWHSRSFGKVFHQQDPVSWSETKFLPRAEAGYPIYGTPESVERQRRLAGGRKPVDWWGFQSGRNDRWVKLNSWASPDVPDRDLFDGQVADAVIEAMRQWKDRPFFLAPGFFRPHLPFVAPQKYFELYTQSELKLPARSTTNAPDYTHYDSAEARTYADIPKSGPLSSDKQRELLRAYYASVSYVDAQIGRILDELARLDLTNQTVVVVWSDHGYHFGEHGTWNKQTNFEAATRSTLIVSAPGQRAAGRSTSGLVEMVDIYPSLCELCGLDAPADVEGFSFAPLLDSPARSWKKAAFSQAAPRGFSGHTMRTRNYRYTQWTRQGKVVAEELYDHRADPDELANLANRRDKAELIARLRDDFAAGWRRALPEPE